jgi:predicted NAD-dependent protein-ADP-ribosyltransferase YbiA (DUF1768 family)
MMTTREQALDKLFFYSKSADVAPGKGPREVVSVQDGHQYTDLSKIPNWRRTLSNFHVSPFVYEGLTYMTIEHAFQAAKIALVDAAAARTFSVDSASLLGLGSGDDARRARKLVYLPGDKIAVWDAMSRAVMEKIARAKYAGCEEARRVLLATQEAQLWHLVPRSSIAEHFSHLERMRSELRVQSSDQSEREH